MSLRRVILSCCLAVSVQAAGVRRASAGEAVGAPFVFDSGTKPSGAETVLAADAEWVLTHIGRAMVAPDSFAVACGRADKAHMKTLPAAPAAALMTLLGFVFVSLARDRRAWVGLVCGLIWLGQGGMAQAPQLARRVCGCAVAETTGAADAICHDAVRHEAHCDEAFRWVALLRKLGIPGDDTIEFTSSDTDRIIGAAVPGVCPHMIYAAAAMCRHYVSLIVFPCRTVWDTNRFSPAFIFSNLSRSPPLLV